MVITHFYLKNLQIQIMPGSKYPISYQNTFNLNLILKCFFNPAYPLKWVPKWEPNGLEMTKNQNKKAK